MPLKQQLFLFGGGKVFSQFSNMQFMKIPDFLFFQGFLKNRIFMVLQI